MRIVRIAAAAVLVAAAMLRGLRPGRAGVRADDHRRRLDLGADRARPVARRRGAAGPEHQLPGRRLDGRAPVLRDRPGRLRRLRDPVPARRAGADAVDPPLVPVPAGRRRRHGGHVQPEGRRPGTQVNNLQLAAGTIAKIFAGKITAWNDPAIRADNPRLALPSTPLVPVIRSDGSGTSAKLADYLAHEAASTWGPFAAQYHVRLPLPVLAEHPARGRRARLGRDGQLHLEPVRRPGQHRLRRGRLRATSTR